MFKKVAKEQLRVPAHIDYLADLRNFVTQVGRKHRVPDKIIKAFKLAIDEAATNIIRHAYRGMSKDAFITLRAIVRKQSVTISLIDQGKYFDPQQIKEPDLQRYVQIGKRGGLGIFIMRRLMDDIDYRKTEEGNELRLTKKLPVGKMNRAISLVPRQLKAIPLNLKLKFWARTAALLTAIATIVYSFFFFQANREIMERSIASWQQIVSQITLQLNDRLQLFDGLGDTERIWGAHVLLNSYVVDRSDEIAEIALVDSRGEIVVSSVWDQTLSQYRKPAESEVARPREHLELYRAEVGEQAKRAMIYDYIYAFETPTQERSELHIRAYKAYIDRLIFERRWNLGRLTLIGLLLSYAGSFLLVYILLNPMRKLAEWVRTAGHGEIEDEIEIDPNTEVGEIAKAFTEITGKFRESQKNLAEQERLQKEMQVAQEIQQALLPKEFPDIEGYEIAGHYEAAQLIGGDYYDFVQVDRDTVGIVVADVSGKGVPGSMVMTMIRQALRTEARGEKDAAEVLARLNELVIGDMKKGMFVTVFYMIIDSKRRRLNYASAGHNPMVLYRASTKKTYYLNPRGFPIGIQLNDAGLFEQSIESDTIQLAEDDLLLLYTDGITEAMNNQRQIFGDERLLQVIRNAGNFRAVPFGERLKSEILSFTEGSPQSDDITFVIIREKTSMLKEELRRAKEAFTLISEGMSIRHACEKAGISTFTYYNKYKKTFEEEGVESIAVENEVSVEAKHISIEEKALVFDIIKNHPEYGAKRISDDLNTEKYNFTQINENKIYDELVRLRLNTRQLREAFVARGARKTAGRPIKPPGTPMLTLDGKVILDDSRYVQYPAPPAERPAPPATGISSESPPKQPAEETTVELDAVADPPVETDDQMEMAEEHMLDIDVGGETGEIAETTETTETTETAETIGTETGMIEATFAGLMGDEAAIVADETRADTVDEVADDQQTGTADADAFSGFDETEAFSKTQDAEASAEDIIRVVEDIPPAPADAPYSGEGEVLYADIDELLQDDGMQVTSFTVDDVAVDGRKDEIAQPKEGDPEGEAARAGIDNTPDSTEIPAESAGKSLDLHEQMLLEGFRLYKSKQYGRAVREFEKIIQMFPDYKEAYRVLANAYYRMQQFEKAIATYRRIKDLDPKDPFPYENMGIVYSKVGRYAEAVDEWQKLLELDPSRHDIRQKVEIILKMQQRAGAV